MNKVKELRTRTQLTASEIYDTAALLLQLRNDMKG